ncbi:peptide-methionine (S)-S-oxide reductase MsrA [Sphingomonas sp. HDW15A]|uniref:peptide-methionine (S)-S-oxide reductase MsrA n=1 Tax=Sphingomonas sp. HDW15A TaxID=2714942 RepID=UPI00140D8526|nr:peptide-methionine (S)-S-oxide reductase MsrA [Sphingomonas sp. HDW15A]QIK95983.1 peptide-methionine (S)-S-oxide reductase MsrA [Sphingomonas sp. HDW15A]
MRSILLLTILLLASCSNASAAESRLLPAPGRDVAANSGLQTAVLAGGCFWGVEAVFEHVKGVRSVESGYAGGGATDANYSAVSSERTKHAEAVRITFDPKAVSYGTLLRVFFSVAHDPTQLNRQGPDIGTSYRSAIFPQSAEQRDVAAAYIAQLRNQFSRPIVTRLESGRFYRAEAYHQDFMRRNPAHPYILAHDRPKILALKRAAPSLYRS